MSLPRLWPGWRLALSTFMLGAVCVAAFAPLSLVPLVFVSLGWLFYAWQRVTSPGQGAVLGLCWGMGCFLTGISWVYVSMHMIGGMPTLMALAMTTLLCFVLSLLYPALCGALFVRFASMRPLANVLLFAALWTLFEWLRGHLFTGFPWLMVAYTQTPTSPLSGYAPVIGAYGIAFIVALLAALFASVLREQGWRVRTPYLVVALLLFVAGALLKHIEWSRPQGAPLAVSLLQGNIAQSIKWDPEQLFYSMAVYDQLSQQYPASLQVFPETAIPLMLDDIPRDYLHRLTRHGTILLGAAVREKQEGQRENAYNGAILFAPGEKPHYYYKAHLVPFGEFVPRGFSWFFDWVNIPLSDFTSGGHEQQPMLLRDQKIAVNICYEDVFGEEIIHQLPQATLLVNLSNTAWFGDSLAQPQHLQMAQMRAMETARMMLRATNSGMTVAIQPHGEITAALPAFTRGGLTVNAQGYVGTTPYVRFGNAPALLLSAIALVAALLLRRRAN